MKGYFRPHSPESGRLLLDETLFLHLCAVLTILNSRTCWRVLKQHTENIKCVSSRKKMLYLLQNLMRKLNYAGGCIILCCLFCIRAWNLFRHQWIPNDFMNIQNCIRLLNIEEKNSDSDIYIITMINSCLMLVLLINEHVVKECHQKLCFTGKATYLMYLNIYLLFITFLLFFITSEICL